MTKTDKNQAIGIFDSGAGGLTVASAVKNLLPEEKIIYFGDTAHLPYGDKSTETVKTYSLKITDFLLERKCKVILIACNTASAAAYEAVKKRAAEKAIVINVIDPATEFVAEQENLKKIGVIGTKGTIQSGSYTKKIKSIQKNKEVVSLQTPLLVPMIEEGFIYDNISNSIIKEYLSNEKLNNIDGLILACTHYPIIKNQIRKFYNFKTAVIDSSVVVAQKLKEILTENNLLNSNKKTPEHEFFISDYTVFFKTLAEMFFDAEINLKTKKL
ncbi:MAG: glutamate racemase [Bacteroidales bacterium]|nr:glutamate racemase [Bacteroidales bacterium]